MKYLGTIGILGLLSGAAIGQDIRVSGNQGDGVQKTYNFSYSRRAEMTFSGTVTGKIKGSPRDGTAESMAILVKTNRGKVYSVDLGPTWYVADQATELKIGDSVKVTGELVTTKNTKSDVEKFVIARRIVKGKRVLALRDPSGYPYWSAFRTGHVAINGASNSITGQIMSQNMVNAENGQQVGYQVKTADGLVNVAVAPNWYLEQQNLGFHVGDTITVYTGQGTANFGNHIILADGLYGYGGTVVLRPGGFPVWQGWTNSFFDGN